jgi:GTP-binding protein
VDVEAEFLGSVLQNLAGRKGEVANMEHHPHGVTVETVIPTRGLIGFETDLLNLTRGTGAMSHLFKEYGPFKGEIPTRPSGVLVALEPGVSTAYALDQLQERARMFVGPGEEVYAGMVVGENSRPEDMIVNACKAKHLTNMRSQGEGKGIQLEPPLKMSLERALEYIGGDEYVEATPSSLRMRKKILDHTKRKRAEQRLAEG